MSKILNKETCLTLLGLGFITGIFYIVWIGVSFFVSNIVLADPKISASIIGAMITALIALATTTITQQLTKLREREEAHREKKVEIYKRFIDTVTSLVAGQIDHLTIQPPTEEELANSLFEYKREILLWGSPKVIKTQVEFQKVGGSDENTFIAVDNLYKAIREDIGLSNNGLNNLELIRLFLKDSR